MREKGSEIQMLVRQHNIPDYQAGDIKRIDIYPEYITVQWRDGKVTRYVRTKENGQDNQEFSQGR